MRTVKQLLWADKTNIEPINGKPWLKVIMVVASLAYFFWIFGPILPLAFPFNNGPLITFNSIGPWNLDDYVQDDLIEVCHIAGGAVLAAIALYCFKPRHRRQSVSLLSHSASFVMALSAFIVSEFAFYAIYQLLTYFHVNPMLTVGDNQRLTIGLEAQILGVVDSSLGPILEEVIALFLIVVALRRCNVPWIWIVCIEGILRVSYHLYQGIPALTHVLWICAVVVIYKCTGSLIGIIVAHEVADIAIEYWPYDYQTIKMTMLGIGVLLCVVLLVERRMRNGQGNDPLIR
ncbi:metal-dependent membrane protease [Bifidobacterium avesanii]|nr:metal-dependent membrane protease [Bifidobacterium avesanii]